MSLIGQRLPTPHYEYTQDQRIRAPMKRICTVCGYCYPTVEIPITDNWSGSLAYACYIHYYPGHVRDAISLTRVRKENKPISSRGLLKAVAFGGYYRRRYCELCICCGHSFKSHAKGQGCTIPTKYNIESLRRGNPGLRLGVPLCPCVTYDICRNEHGRQTGWSTVEVTPEGIVSEDVTKCPRCGGPAAALLPGVLERSKRSPRAIEAAIQIQLAPPSYYRPLMTYLPTGKGDGEWG